MIPFNRLSPTGNEQKYVLQAIQSGSLSGDGIFGKKCQVWFEENLGCLKALLTPSCTAALEMAALLIDIRPDDEVIMPSYTFVSTANAFVLRGARIVFVDIRPDTMNINETLIEEAITSKTRAIVPVHYAGVGCNMEVIMKIANRHGLFVVEDAAQGMMSTYNGQSLGTIGHLGTLSFHETKNYTSGGEGGLLVINDKRFLKRAMIIREKGTNRTQFLRGEVDKYSWCDVGSSYLPSELQAAYLWGQLEKAKEVNISRLSSWKIYYEAFKSLSEAGIVELPHIPSECQHNAHIFYLKLKDRSKRSIFIDSLKRVGVNALFHYIPLHASEAGRIFGTFHGEDKFTMNESERLVRLPLFYGISREQQEQVIYASIVVLKEGSL